MKFDWGKTLREIRFAAHALDSLMRDERRLVIIGGRGWIGRTLLGMLADALGPDRLAARVACFGSAAASICLDNDIIVEQRPLDEIQRLSPQPTMLFHLAFLTKDKAADMDSEIYAAANRSLSTTVRDALKPIGVDRLFVASSGAAAFADDIGAAADLRLYGALKRDDEASFLAWAEADPENRRVAIGRIFSVSGPWINKHDTYALASFILDALAGRTIDVRAPMRVFRSYVAVRELLSLVVSVLLEHRGDPVLQFGTGGEPLELVEVAACVARTIGGRVNRKPIEITADNRYIGDCDKWNALLAQFGMSHLGLDDQIRETAAWLEHQSH